MLTQFIDWFWRDRNTGRIVVAQWPNLWLWTFVAASLLERIAGKAVSAGLGLHIAANVLLAIWAGDELLRGVNPWRRCLGAAVLVWTAIRLFV